MLYVKMKKFIFSIIVIIFFSLSAVAQLPTGAPPPPDFDNEILIYDNEYEDTEYYIDIGETITWVNDDETSHTVTADDGSFDSGTLGPGETFSHSFSTAGEFNYHCNFHTAMVGKIIVEDYMGDTTASPTSPTTTSPTTSPTTTSPTSTSPSTTTTSPTVTPSSIPSAPLLQAPPVTTTPPSLEQPIDVQYEAEVQGLRNDMSDLGSTLTGIAQRVQQAENTLDAVKTEQQRLQGQTAPEESQFTLPIIILFTLLILLVIHVVYLTFRHQHIAEHVAHLRKQISPNKEAQLDHYISGCMRKGMKQEQIKEYLEEHGWDQTDVEQAFSKYKG